MSYRETARAFATAESNNHPAHGGQAADSLPVSDWAESRREHMTPQTIAANHALHVESAAAELREALWNADVDNPMQRLALLADVEDAARALLAAIGEGEGAR
ncbi:hypothetical protein [Microbacterium sp. No. 7]|uniref:hypothetical protein n=1 Tax=Microbacterium sp. No. 7 TaxID=1714373 RepID=UPI0006D1EFBA|nr:hypothetical protein [Microbacterium sp. No. 7]ALJ19522.1 hypothetical protein AOA12_06210 [Microbacterium sp. No. 7]